MGKLVVMEELEENIAVCYEAEELWYFTSG